MYTKVIVKLVLVALERLPLSLYLSISLVQYGPYSIRDEILWYTRMLLSSVRKRVNLLCDSICGGE